MRISKKNKVAIVVIAISSIGFSAAWFATRRPPESDIRALQTAAIEESRQVIATLPKLSTETTRIVTTEGTGSYTPPKDGRPAVITNDSKNKTVPSL